MYKECDIVSVDTSKISQFLRNWIRLGWERHVFGTGAWTFASNPQKESYAHALGLTERA